MYYSFRTVPGMGGITETARNKEYIRCPFCSENRKGAHKLSRCMELIHSDGFYLCHNCGVHDYTPEAKRDYAALHQTLNPNRSSNQPNRNSNQPYRNSNQPNRSNGSEYAKKSATTAVPPATAATTAAAPAAAPTAKPAPLTWEPEIGEVAKSYLHKRKLKSATLKHFRVGETRRMFEKQLEPCIGIPNYIEGELVNIKYRRICDTQGDRFRMAQGGRLAPFHLSSCLEAETVIFTEGEIDAMSIWQTVNPAGKVKIGIVSCPNGGSSGTEWLNPYIKKYFADKKLIFLAGDNDETGFSFLAQIAERFGAWRCRLVHWPDGCKDANDTLVRFGEDAVRECLTAAKGCSPIGTVRVSDINAQVMELYSRREPDRGLQLHWGKTFDEHCRINMGSVAILIGKEGEGKSAWVDEFCLRLALIHDMKICMWTPETKYMAKHIHRLLRLLYGRRKTNQTSWTGHPDQFRQGMEFISKHYTYIDFPYPDSYESMTPEEKIRYQPTVDNLRDKAKYFALADGCRVFVFDPVLLIRKSDPYRPAIDHFSDIIDMAKFIAHQYNAFVFLVHHPHRNYATNLQKSDRPVTTEDIYGSSQFAYLLDYTFAINRFDATTERPKPYVSQQIGKVKEDDFGTRGYAFFSYQINGGRFIPVEVEEVKDLSGTIRQQPIGKPYNPYPWLDSHGLPDLKALETALNADNYTNSTPV